MAIRWTAHKFIRILSVVSVALVFFTFALRPRVALAQQQKLDMTQAAGLLLSLILPLALYLLMVARSPRPQRRRQWLDAGLVVAGWGLLAFVVVLIGFH